ncbi:MAG: CoA ester lyase [Pseudomonadota bacterium]
MTSTTTAPPERLHRSSLTVPLSNEKFIAKAHLRGADNITLDLEDGVAVNAKEAARLRLPDAVKSAARGGATIKIRLNRPLGLLVRDLEAAVIAGVDSLGIAKVESAGHIRIVSEFVAELERERGLPPGGIKLSASIETPQALSRVHEIASADLRLASIGLGSLDFASACGFAPSFETLLAPKQLVMYAAKAAGIESGGYVGGIADYTDLEALRQVIRRSKLYGFHGGGAIHPDQVRVLNEEYGPSVVQVADARAIIAMADEAFADGKGAFAFKGKMIDKPVVDAARKVVAMAEAIEAHEQRQRALLAQNQIS